MDAVSGCSESGREHVHVGCNLEAAVQVLGYLFEPSESFNITHNNFLPLLEVRCPESLAFTVSQF